MAVEVALRQHSLGRLIFALDRRLRRRQSVIEYLDHPECILRIQIGKVHDDVTLTSGVRLHPGDRLIDLHLWNEHLPVMGRRGPSVAWARKISKLLNFSLRGLSIYLAARPDLDDISVIRALMPLRGAEQSGHVRFIAARYGFESLAEAAPRSLGARLHRAGENALGLMLMLASNPGAVHLDILLRGRAPLFLSRRDLDDRYRSCSAQRAVGAIQ